MRILLTGSKGQLGREIRLQAPAAAVDCIGIDINDADITDPDQVHRIFADTRPELLINAAAYTQVDAAETNPAAAFAVNRDAAAYLAQACATARVPMLHISTDFVFSGKQRTPYGETDPVAPLGIYAQSKAAGESVVRQSVNRHLIIRTAWLYGAYGQNFVKTMLTLGRQNSRLRVVADQVGCPTWATDFAGALLTLCGHIGRRPDIPWGTYHLCGRGAVSWHGFAERIFHIAGRLGMCGDVKVTPVTTPEYPTPAPRPAYSALACEKIEANFGIVAPPWQASLEKMIRHLYQTENRQV